MCSTFKAWKTIKISIFLIDTNIKSNPDQKLRTWNISNKLKVQCWFFLSISCYISNEYCDCTKIGVLLKIHRQMWCDNKYEFRYYFSSYPWPAWEFLEKRLSSQRLGSRNTCEYYILFFFCPIFFCLTVCASFNEKKTDIFHDRFMIKTIREIRINGEEIKTKPNDDHILAYAMQITILNQPISLHRSTY